VFLRGEAQFAGVVVRRVREWDARGEIGGDAGVFVASSVDAVELDETPEGDRQAAEVERAVGLAVVEERLAGCVLVVGRNGHDGGTRLHGCRHGQGGRDRAWSGDRAGGGCGRVRSGLGLGRCVLRLLQCGVTLDGVGLKLLQLLLQLEDLLLDGLDRRQILGGGGGAAQQSGGDDGHGEENDSGAACLHA
jgi:hypothetical protein